MCRLNTIASLALLVIIAFVSPASGQEQQEQKEKTRPPGSYAFSLGFTGGILYGTSYEIVYTFPGSAQYLSELRWEIQPLWLAGLSLSFAPGNPFSKIAFYTELEVRAGLPAQTGVMEDRDWLQSHVGFGPLTHFSSHENHTKLAFLADFEAGFSFPVQKLLTVQLSLNLYYMFFKFEAWNGYTQYGANGTFSGPPYDVWQPSFGKDPVSGLGIDYTQHWFIAGPGIGVSFFLRRLTVSAACSVSPLIFCIAVDNHYKRNLPFRTNEYMVGRLFLEPEASLAFTFSRLFSLGIQASYRFISGTRGDTTNFIGPAAAKQLDTAGTAFQAIEGTVKLCFTW